MERGLIIFNRINTSTLYYDVSIIRVHFMFIASGIKNQFFCSLICLKNIKTDLYEFIRP